MLANSLRAVSEIIMSERSQSMRRFGMGLNGMGAFSQEDSWDVLRFHPNMDAPDQVDLTETSPGLPGGSFSHDATTTSAGKHGPPRKANQTHGGTVEVVEYGQFGELMEQELRLKREAAERASKLKP
ncbi:hypothetical protein Tco_0698969 [Tanacetum coccineum]